jgi:hypothetical protein
VGGRAPGAAAVGGGVVKLWHEILAGDPHRVVRAVLAAELSLALLCAVVHATRDHGMFPGLARALGGRTSPDPDHHRWFSRQPAPVRWLVSAAWTAGGVLCALLLPYWPGAVALLLAPADAVALTVLFHPARGGR